MPRFVGGSFQGGCYLFLDYSYTQNVAANTSTISYAFGVHFGDYYFNATNKSIILSAGPGTGGTSWTEAGNRAWPHGGTHQDYVYKTGSFVLTHDVNGNATFFVNGKFNPSATGGGGTRTVVNHIGLTPIPRFSNPPSVVTLSSVTSTTMFATFNDGGGGAPIDSRQIGYGTNPSSPTTIVASDRSTDITGLTPGTTYYFWARTHNVAGYTAWGPRSQATTWRVPSAPPAPVISDRTMTSVVATWTPPDNGGTGITAYQVGYGTSSAGPASTVTGNSPQTVTGLLPGRVHYFWVRAQNAVGWGPWSAPTTAQTVAGVRVKVGADWVLAVPYVRDGGDWVLARPWAKNAGVWKETE